MAVSELSGLDGLTVRLIELEAREAEIEQRLAALVGRHSRLQEGADERELAGLRRDHLGVRRELNTLRARLVPILPR